VTVAVAMARAVVVQQAVFHK